MANRIMSTLTPMTTAKKATEDSDAGTGPSSDRPRGVRVDDAILRIHFGLRASRNGRSPRFTSRDPTLVRDEMIGRRPSRRSAVGARNVTGRGPARRGSASVRVRGPRGVWSGPADQRIPGPTSCRLLASRRAIDHRQRDDAIEAALVEKADRIGVADRAVAQSAPRQRIAVVQHVESSSDRVSSA